MSSASSSRSWSAWATSSSSHAERSVRSFASGSASATRSSVRSSVSGVRSSCEALATNRRGLERGLEPAEQVIERVAKLLELVVGTLEREPLLQVGVALLAAGCGGSSPPSTTGSAASPTPGNFVADAYKYSACMRDHGVANFPDPKVSHSGGGTQVAIRAIGPASSPQYNSAQQACRGILPAPSKAELAQQAQDQRIHAQDLLSFARCLA